MLKHIKNRNDQPQGLAAKGFTLIELLVVIVILGLLAAAAIFAIGGIRGDAETASCDTEEKTIQTAAEAAFVRNGSYPATGAAADWDNLTDGVNPARWTYTATGTPVGSEFTLVGQGVCA